MRFVKTKFGVSKLVDIKSEWNDATADYENRWYTDNAHYFLEDDVEEVANTIGELCDEFICPELEYMNEDFRWFIYDLRHIDMSKISIYGAIWTEWGLKYVAKMNEKGELELL